MFDYYYEIHIAYNTLFNALEKSAPDTAYLNKILLEYIEFNKYSPSDVYPIYIENIRKDITNNYYSEDDKYYELVRTLDKVVSKDIKFFYVDC